MLVVYKSFLTCFLSHCSFALVVMTLFFYLKKYKVQIRLGLFVHPPNNVDNRTIT
jgi:hypothetical protein